MPRPTRLQTLLLVGATLFASLASAQPAPEPKPREIRVDVRTLQRIPNQSGPDNYYSFVDSPEGAYVHAAYKPPYETAVIGYKLPEDQRRSVAKVSWKWRAVTLPSGGDECARGRGDSAAVVYLTWKRGLRWYTLKYVWSGVGQKGAVCDKHRNPFRAQDTIIVESGEPLNEWRTVEVDPDQAFRKHFEDGDPNADVPDMAGFGIMTDGDQTRSVSEADFGDFVITLK